MKCNVCGRYTQNDEANFCEYCGSSFRERMQSYNDNHNSHNSHNSHYESSQAISSDRERYGVPYPEQDNRPVTFLNYLGSYGLFFIPFAGWLIFFVMLFIWAFSNNIPVSKKNWARATLIFIGVLMFFVLLYLMYVVSSPIFQDMMNGTFDYNNYIQSID